MATQTVPERRSTTLARPARRRSATQVVVAVLGAVVGLAGVEHGIGEILQGSVPGPGLFIQSWPHAPALEILSGEPAMTVIPNLLATGVLAVLVGVAVVVWSVWFATRRRGGLVLVGLSVLLLLLGGGLAPPVMGMALGAVATRAGTTSRPPGRVRQRLAPAWAWFLGAALIGYLGLMPGTVVASAWGATVGDAVVIGFAALAFSGLGLSLTAALAHDRLSLR